jgi:hypothetical protein
MADNQPINAPTKIPINKYSIYELKSAIDTKIIEVRINLILYNVLVPRRK